MATSYMHVCNFLTTLWQKCITTGKVPERKIWQRMCHRKEIPRKLGLIHRIPRWTQGKVRASRASTDCRCRRRSPRSPPLCQWRCHNRHTCAAGRRSIRGCSRLELIWSPDKVGWVGRGGRVGGGRRQEWRRLDLEDLRNCRTCHQGGICCKRQITMLSRLDDIFDFKFRQ